MKNDIPEKYKGIRPIIKLLFAVGGIALFVFVLSKLGGCAASCAGCGTPQEDKLKEMQEMLGVETSKTDEESEAEPTGQPRNNLNANAGTRNKVRISVDTANVRSGPGTDSPVIGLAPFGEEYSVTGNVVPVGESLWHEIIFEDNSAGWVSEKVIDLIE